MMRRVPEYQKRVTDDYRKLYESLGDERPDTMAVPLDLDSAREYLIFQIMQVLSAPLIAIVAYSLFDPNELASVVAVGFIAGFSSEAVLLAIRAVFDKVGQS